MKLHKPIIDNVTSGGVKDQAIFKLAPTAEAFRILSSGMYTDPITAIMRELSCNAWDAQIVAGNSHIPFDVSMPGRFSPLWKIRDYGTGLTHEQVMNLYVTYFNSTKTDDNTQVGALGIGSKSPLGYTQSFSVVSYQDGEMRIYSVFIGDDDSETPGFPSIAYTGCQPTDQPNGMEISVPTQSNDFAKWEQAARNVYKWFPLLPNFIENGITIEQPSPVRVIGKVSITSMDVNNYHSRWYVVQGNIAYPLDFSLLDKHYVQLYSNMSGFITVDIGEVMMAANRETLNYTKATIEALEAALAKFEKVFESEMVEEVNKCTKYKEAFDLLQEIRKSKYLSKCKVKDLAIAKVEEFLDWMWDEPVKWVQDPAFPDDDTKKIKIVPPVKIGNPLIDLNGRFTKQDWNPAKLEHYSAKLWSGPALVRVYQLFMHDKKDIIEDKEVPIYSINESGYNSNRKHTVRPFNPSYGKDEEGHQWLSLSEGLHIVYNDTGRSGKSTIANHLRFTNDYPRGHTVIFINKYTDEQVVKDLANYLFTTIDIPVKSIKAMSNLNIVSRTGKRVKFGETGSKAACLYWEYGENIAKWAKGTPLQEQIDDTSKTFFWFTCKNVEPTDSTLDPKSVLTKLHRMNNGINDIWGIKEADVPLIKDLPNWLHINGAYEKIIRESLTPNVLEKFGREEILCGLQKWIDEIHSSNLLNTIKCEDFKELVSVRVQPNNNNNHHHIRSLFEYAKEFDVDINNISMKALEDKLKDVYNRVIGLKLILENTYATHQNVIEIIKLVNHFSKQEKQT